MEGDDGLHLRFDVGVPLLLGLLEEEDDDVETLFDSILEAAVDVRGWRVVETATATGASAAASPPAPT